MKTLTDKELLTNSENELIGHLLWNEYLKLTSGEGINPLIDIEQRKKEIMDLIKKVSNLKA